MLAIGTFKLILTKNNKIIVVDSTDQLKKKLDLVILLSWSRIKEGIKG